jgi:hypothetical protein
VPTIDLPEVEPVRPRATRQTGLPRGAAQRYGRRSHARVRPYLGAEDPGPAAVDLGLLGRVLVGLRNLDDDVPAAGVPRGWEDELADLTREVLDVRPEVGHGGDGAGRVSRLLHPGEDLVTTAELPALVPEVVTGR